MLDHGTAIYVLLGGSSGSRMEDPAAVAAAAHAFVDCIAAGRLPLPDVHFIEAVSETVNPTATAGLT